MELTPPDQSSHLITLIEEGDEPFNEVITNHHHILTSSCNISRNLYSILIRCIEDWNRGDVIRIHHEHFALISQDLLYLLNKCNFDLKLK